MGYCWQQWAWAVGFGKWMFSCTHISGTFSHAVKIHMEDMWHVYLVHHMATPPMADILRNPRILSHPIRASPSLPRLSGKLSPNWLVQAGHWKSFALPLSRAMSWICEIENQRNQRYLWDFLLLLTNQRSPANLPSIFYKAFIAFLFSISRLSWQRAQCGKNARHRKSLQMDPC